MTRVLPFLLLMAMGGCPTPAPPKPTPTPEPTPPVLTCANMDCAPGNHCVETPAGPKCVKDEQQSACPRPLAPGARLYVNAKPWGQGQDSTYRIANDPAFCEAIHGIPGMNDCHLEGWPTRAQCELELAGGCPTWQFRIAGNPQPRPCLQVASDPAISCDHFGSPPGDQRDDPQTSAFEGKPAECGLQRDPMGNPKAGFFTIAHGLGEVRACKPDGTECSGWLGVDH